MIMTCYDLLSKPNTLTTDGSNHTENHDDEVPLVNNGLLPVQKEDSIHAIY